MNPNIIKLITFFLISFLTIPICNFSFAASTDQSAINQQDWISRQQQDKIEEDKRIREQNAIKKERARKKKEEEKNQKQNLPVSGKPVVCRPIKEIKLTNADSISKRKQQKLTAPFLGKCFEGKVLSDLVSSINSYYNEKGYVTARVSIPKQNIQSGTLELNVLEGKIEKIIIGDDRFVDKMQAITAFGIIEGDVLDIEDINQGLYQINRLPSNNATMKIEPGDNEGEAAILIANEKKFPARANMSYDNLGNNFTGVRRTSFAGSLDNMLFLNDNINLNYSTNADDDNADKDIKSFSSGISVPFGYNTLSYDYSRSNFKGTNPGTNGPIILTGFSDRNNLGIDRVLFNKGNLRISGNTSLTTKGSASYLNQEKIETSERKLTIASAGFSISNYFQNGVNLYMKPSFSKGLKILNSKQDDPSATGDIPKAQFEVYKLYASLSKRFIIPKIEAPVILSTEMDSQISRDTLFGSEQFSVGGYYSVRGFREDYITGDNGYYFRNKANFNVGSLILPFINKENPGYLTNLNKFKFEPFYDYGYVQNKYDKDSGRLSGTGIKTIFESKYFIASLTYSWAINKSRLITSTEKENRLVYFEVSAGLF